MRKKSKKSIKSEWAFIVAMVIVMMMLTLYFVIQERNILQDRVTMQDDILKGFGEEICSDHGLAFDHWILENKTVRCKDSTEFAQ